MKTLAQITQEAASKKPSKADVEAYHALVRRLATEGYATGGGDPSDELLDAIRERCLRACKDVQRDLKADVQRAAKRIQLAEKVKLIPALEAAAETTKAAHSKAMPEINRAITDLQDRKVALATERDKAAMALADAQSAERNLLREVSVVNPDLIVERREVANALADLHARISRSMDGDVKDDLCAEAEDLAVRFDELTAAVLEA